MLKLQDTFCNNHCSDVVLPVGDYAGAFPRRSVTWHAHDSQNHPHNQTNLCGTRTTHNPHNDVTMSQKRGFEHLALVERPWLSLESRSQCLRSTF
eukprot:2843930-Amphidinium_carterae.1